MHNITDELFGIYSQLKREIDQLPSGRDPHYAQFNKIILRFKERLLFDNRLNDFHRIAETEKIVKTCHLMIDNKFSNCSKGDLGIAQYFDNFYLT